VYPYAPVLHFAIQLKNNEKISVLKAKKLTNSIIKILKIQEKTILIIQMVAIATTTMQ
jgi:hypothetical protein